MGLLKKIDKNEKVKKEMIDLVNKSLYFLRQGRTGTSLDKEVVKEGLEAIESSLVSFENSFGSGEKDLNRVKPVIEKACKDIVNASKQNLDSVYKEACYKLVSALTMGSDLLNDLDLPVNEEDEKTQWDKKLIEIKRVDELFEKLSLDAREKAKSLEARKTELEDKLLATTDNGIESQQIAFQLDDVESQINLNTALAINFASCDSTTKTIIAMAEALVKTSTLSGMDYARAKKIIDVKKIKAVYEDPKSVQPILKLIQNELEQFNKDIQLRRQQAAAIMPSSVSSEALDERRAKILKERLAKQGVVSEQEVSKEDAIVNDILNK
ncbi:MAG: hypothetical protein K6E21_01040 [Bacilli bacterium]|nr:hypothetical protein [Bacilli bacterium]